MEEFLSRQIQTVLTDYLPNKLVYFNAREPRMALVAPKKIVCAEAYNLDRSRMPLIQIFSPNENELGYSISWSQDSADPEHIYVFYIDIWISGSDPEDLYYQLLRYKEAIKATLRDHIGLEGYATGSVCRGSSNSNLLGTSDRLVQAGRINYYVVAEPFFDYPKDEALADT